MIRARLISLALCLAGAGIIWFNPSEQLRAGTRAVALVALAGVGALIATRGVLRRLVAILMVIAGLWLILGATALSIVGGIIVVAGGVIAVATCNTWPVLGARFSRQAKASGAQAEQTDLWAALDRGEDPTAR